ncbi:low affinity tryptophan permease TnaB [Escherichia coli]|uniref:low affinity tryptophan permease TnaB n=1 Tax=Escherichia coli TaxID=562 RepID=UPI000D136A2F|nr:low affinity tryptophan permease TnaB [Escherichia coli]EEZ5199876.1 low affinity tryptophan permease TnaB [Escherichia coli]EFM5768040.1 low affinity tryptophan permease TnaB [Escherichia coli]
MTDQAEKKHSAFWGVMVIAGTVIGGGMFALPVDLAGAWFFWGAFILIIAWFSMLHSGLLLLEANLNYPVGSSFNTITKDLIGNTWNIISGITVAFVLYILTYAYISANGAIISETISMNLGYHANPRIVGIFTAIFVASVLWISSLAASRITSLFLGLKIISFVIVFGSFFFQVDYSILRDATSTTAGTSYFPYIFMALPVCLASFGFHGNIPSLIICYGKRKDKLIKSVLLTFLPPALLYLIFPNGFIYGIGGAGLCATIWAVIIPAVLAIKARKKFPNQMFTVWGGNLIPAIVILFGITVILCWFGNVFNVLPKFG